MIGPIIGTGYKRVSNTLTVFNYHVNNLSAML